MPESGGQPQHDFCVQKANRRYEIVPHSIPKDQPEQFEPNNYKNESPRSLRSKAAMYFGIYVHAAVCAWLCERDYYPSGKLLDELRSATGFDVDKLIERLLYISYQVGGAVKELMAKTNSLGLVPSPLTWWSQGPAVLTSSRQELKVMKIADACRQAYGGCDEVPGVHERLSTFFTIDWGKRVASSEGDMREVFGDDEDLMPLKPYYPKPSSMSALRGKQGQIRGCREYERCWSPAAMPDMICLQIARSQCRIVPRLRALFSGNHFGRSIINDPHEIGTEGVRTLRELAHLMAEDQIMFHVFEIKNNFGGSFGSYEKYLPDIAHTVLAIWNLFATWADPKDLPGVFEALQAHLVHVHIPCLRGKGDEIQIRLPEQREIKVYDLVGESLAEWLYRRYLKIIEVDVPERLDQIATIREFEKEEERYPLQF